jgi:tRNA1(Val) A37 N6-methylase TrmN6
MSRYYTPIDVARALARHAPRQISTLMEPAAGTGVLLEPLKRRLLSCSKIICIDKDSKALAELKSKFSPLLGSKIKIIRGDFLSLPQQAFGKVEASGFDCIIMNPPFDGRRSKLVEIDRAVEMPGVGKENRRIPIEMAFVLRAVRLLKPAGCLLAVVPSSVVSSLSTKWLREYLFRIGTVKFVHELPRFTFEDLRGRVYLFVFKKQERQGGLVLLNHDLAEPESIEIKRSELTEGLRLDYGFYRARSWLDEVKRKKRLKWLSVGEVAEIFRGDMASPEGARHAIHTTSYRDGFWGVGDRKKHLKRGNTACRVRRSDLMVKRVGRNCASSFGIVTDAEGYASSDCVIIIRPTKRSDRLKLLFALRTALGAEAGAALLERGTGAPYLTVAELPSVQIPINLAFVYKQTFSKYEEAVRRKSFADMLSLEEQVRRKLYLRGGRY